MRALHISLLSVASLLGTVFVIACSSPQPPATSGDDSNDTSGDPSASTTKKPATSSTDPTDPSTPAPTTGDAAAPPPVVTGDASTPPPTQMDCSTTTTADSCYQCCDTNNAPGEKPGDDAYFGCICQNPGVCAQACAASMCSAAGSDPDQQCQNCLDSQNASQCDNVADQACQAVPTCVAAQQCVQTNNCDNKQ